MISVIIPLYNKSASIERTIDSVLKQSYPDFEMVIVDDGSTDDSADKVSNYLADKRVLYIKKTNGGVSSARNYGVAHSKGDWILFLDADDILLPNCLEVLFNLVERNSVDVSTANMFCERNGKKWVYSIASREHIVKDPFKEWVLRQMILRTGNTLMARDVAMKHPYREDLSRFEDLESVIEIMKNYKIAYSPEPVMVYTSDNAGLSIKDSNYTRDFISYMPTEYESLWECMLYVQLLDGGLYFYPHRNNELIAKYPEYYKRLKELKIRLLPTRIKNKLCRIIGINS